MSFTLVELKDFLTRTSNKWVLNITATPLFFLWAQLAIAALLFVVSDALRLLPDRLTLDLATCKDLIPMVGLNVFGLRSVHFACMNGMELTTLQLLQLHSEIRRRFLLPSRPRPCPPIHRVHLLHRPSIPPFLAHPPLLRSRHLWLLCRCLPGWYTSLLDWCWLRRRQLSTHSDTFGRHQAELECCRRKCARSILVHEPP